MVDKDGRNFRAFYYDTLGLRNVEQRKALEILLKDDPIGTEVVTVVIFTPGYVKTISMNNAHVRLICDQISIDLT